MQHLKIDIQGNLKDTGYMYFIKQIAYLNELNGYIKYTDDDSEIVSVEGEPESVKLFIDLSRIGSYNSHIDTYEIFEFTSKYFSTFEIL